MDNTTLYQLAIKLSNSIGIEELQSRTGLTVAWLQKFRQGQIHDPSVNRIEQLLRSFGIDHVSFK